MDFYFDFYHRKQKLFLKIFEKISKHTKHRLREIRKYRHRNRIKWFERRWKWRYKIIGLYKKIKSNESKKLVQKINCIKRKF